MRFLRDFLFFPLQRAQHGPALLGLAALLFLLHAIKLLLSLDGELHPDEAYYWAWSQFPALSYYDQGPAVAYYIWIWTTILGSSYLTLKIAALAASFVTIYFFCLAGRDWGLWGWQPLLSALSLFFVPGIIGGNALIMHDSVMILAWAGALWMAVRVIRWQGFWSLLGLFFFLGLGGLSKYTMFLFALGLVLWLLLHPDYRRLWIHPGSWAGLVLAALMISPIIIWNYNHHWDGVGAIIHLRSSGGVSGGASTGAYLTGQLIMFSPLWMTALILLSLILIFKNLRGFRDSRHWLSLTKRKTARGKDTGGSSSSGFLNSVLRRGSAWSEQTGDLFWIMTALPFLFFAFLSGNREIQANWVFMAYGPAVLLLIRYLFSQDREAEDASPTPSFKAQDPAPTTADQSLRPSVEATGLTLRAPLRRYLKWIYMAGWIPVLLLDVFFLFSVPLASGSSLETYWIPGYRTAGFQQVIQNVEKLQREKHPEAELVANRYQDASIGWFYNQDQDYVPSINIMQRNQFSYWPGLEKGKDYLFYHIQENTCEKSMSFLGVILPTFFEDVVEYPEREILIDGRVVKRYQVWFARGYRYPWDQKMFEYLRDEAIYQNMVGLRIPEEGKVVNVNKAFEEFTKLWAQIYMSRKGKQDCSLF